MLILMKGIFSRPCSLWFIIFFSLMLGGYRASSQIFILEDTARIYTANQVLELFNAAQAKPLQGNRFNPGFTASVFWLIVRTELGRKEEERLVIGNAQINKIDFYKVDKPTQQPQLQYTAGDHYPFNQKPINHRLFVFPMEKSDASQTNLIRIDKHNESLQLTAQIYSLEDFQQVSSSEGMITGILTGALVFILLLGSFLYIVTRDKLYLFYILYLIVAWLWVYADKGFAFQYLWPDYPYFGNRARPVFFLLSMAAILQFMRVFIGQTPSSRWYKWISHLQIAFLILCSTALFEIESVADGKLLFFLLMVVLPMGFMAFVLIILSLIEKAKEGNILVWYYIVSVAVYVSFALFEMMAHSGVWLFSNYFLSNFGIHTGLLLEAIILLFGLAIQFNTYRKEREQLLIDINKKQEELTTKVFETQENERKKIADQLHDEVGSMLSVVSLNISSVLEKKQENPQSQSKLQSAFEALGNAASLVRNISHTLTPIAIEKYGFKRAVDNLLASINTSQKLKIESVVIGFDQTDRYSTSMLNDIFRSIQEILNNTIKHSGASHAYLELIEHDDIISLMIEDNGQGMPENLKKGNGLENIFSRINYFKGTIDINSSAESGTLIVIEIPTSQN